MGQIVKVNVTVTAAPAPATLQQTGALVSQGGTLLAPGTYRLLTQLSDLTNYLTGSKAVTSISQTGGVATVTTTAPHGFTVTDTLALTIAGANQTAYNGVQSCTVTGTSTFTFAVPSGTTTPATGTIVYTPEDVSELLAMATTFFAGGTQVGVYVLELGAGNAADGVAALTNYLTANPNSNYTPGAVGFFYAYLVPRYWASSAAYWALLQQYDSPNSQTYFFTTATLANYTNFNNLMKSAFALIEVPVTGAWPVNALTAIAYTGLWPANALTAISWTTGVVTATTTTAHGVLPGEYFSLSGCTPVGFNGTFLALDGTTNETLVYALATNPGAETVLGTLTASAGGTVTATTTTNHGVAVGQWFQITGCVPLAYNGWYQAILGTGTTSLVYAVPAAIGAESTLGSLVASTVALPGPAVTEFDCAAEFWQWLQQTPTQGNLLNPFAFRFLYGVTPWPPATFSSLFATLKAANVNIVGTGSEGGITTATSFWGTTMDGNDANFWYSVDWWAINSDIALANAIINGSNSQPPLDYDQNGINKLQSVLVGVMTQAVALGMALGQVVVTTLPAQTFAQNFANGVYSGQVVVNAVPFASYVALSPSDYPIGKYAGFSVAATPKRGFTQILFNINAVEFA